MSKIVQIYRNRRMCFHYNYTLHRNSFMVLIEYTKKDKVTTD